jgi:hypothetical protein
MKNRKIIPTRLALVGACLGMVGLGVVGLVNVFSTAAAPAQTAQNEKIDLGWWQELRVQRASDGCRVTGEFNITANQWLVGLKQEIFKKSGVDIKGYGGERSGADSFSSVIVDDNISTAECNQLLKSYGFK